MLAERLPTPVVGDGYHAPEGFVAMVADQYAAHQMNITWASDSKQESVVLCNCGWVGTRWRPEVLGAILHATTEYEDHLRDAGYIPRG